MHRLFFILFSLFFFTASLDLVRDHLAIDQDAQENVLEHDAEEVPEKSSETEDTSSKEILTLDTNKTFTPSGHYFLGCTRLAYSFYPYLYTMELLRPPLS